MMGYKWWIEGYVSLGWREGEKWEGEGKEREE